MMNPTEQVFRTKQFIVVWSWYIAFLIVVANINLQVNSSFDLSFWTTELACILTLLLSTKGLYDALKKHQTLNLEIRNQNGK